MWPLLQEWERAGLTVRAMVGKLTEHGIQAHRSSIGRTLLKIREATIEAAPPAADLDEWSDADEIREIRRIARRLLYSRNPFAALAAARLLQHLRSRTSTDEPTPRPPDASPSMPVFTVQKDRR